jgi:FkbH-like protein
VIVLDCDQTLWKGVCGEDGPDGIAIDPPRRFLQEFMVRQYQSGVLLCICSKNNEPDVWEVFDRRPEMPLKREHFVAWRINWEPKSSNIKSLAQELQLGSDSFVFVDDDPVVCSEVQTNAPEVLILNLPADAGQIPDYLENYWAFDHLSITAEDLKRSDMYRQNAERHRLLEKSANLSDFLQSLELKCEISEMGEENLSRVAQLTQRTNQFNATTIRRNESEIRKIINESGARCLVVHVRDRFGDYGLVGAIIFFTRPNELEVDTFLLSCRALGRGVEHRMIAALGGIALEAHLRSVTVRFVETKKNRPVSDFLERTCSAYREADGSAVLFRYPVQVAAELSLSTEAGRQAVDEGSPKPSAESPAASTPEDLRSALLSKTAGLHSIANELHRPEILLARTAPVETTRSLTDVAYEAPRSDLEKELVELWQNLLKVRPIGIRDNYFELGGDSFLAVRLFVEIEKKLGTNLPLATLVTAPTIGELARCLNSTETSWKWRHLVPIQAEGAMPPLYCMHAAGGNVLFYRDLATHLGKDQPVYGLQARENEKTGTYPDRVEDMATLYLNEILEFQPQGPYYLCGSSFGGLLAYEMAQQLKALKKEVALLALFDTHGPGYPQSLSDSVVCRHLFSLVARMETLRGQLRELQGREKLEFFWAKAKKGWKKIRRRSVWKMNEFQIRYSQTVGGDLPKDLQRNHKAIQRALEDYIPQPYYGKLTLFRASIQPKGIVPDPYLGWKDLSSDGIEVFECQGSHGAMTVAPYAKALAEKLCEVLNNCDFFGKRTPIEAQLAPLEAPGSSLHEGRHFLHNYLEG